MAGALVLNPSSPHYLDLKQYQNLRYEDLLYDEDAVVLEKNSRDFRQRMSRINQTTRSLVAWLQRQPQVERVYTPYSQPSKWGDAAVPPSLSSGHVEGGAEEGDGVSGVHGQQPHAHHPCLKTDSSSPGFGGLFSLVLRHSSHTSAAFYDCVRISKGPSLGNSFSLLCPYTLLAHYAELDWAESVGIPRFLLRFSIGLEDESDLQHRLTLALQHITPIIEQHDQQQQQQQLYTPAPHLAPVPPPTSHPPSLSSPPHQPTHSQQQQQQQH